MARCPDCNKFVSLDSEQDPECSLDVDESGEVTGSIQIANACAECGTEMFTAEFDAATGPDAIIRTEDSMTLADWLKRCQEFKATGALAEDEDDEIEMEVDEGDMERTTRTEGKGRGTRTFYGARVGFTVKVTFRGATSEFEGSVEDDIQASSMDQAY
jgi:hypothetical protein